jgi:hypothetical protein
MTQIYVYLCLGLLVALFPKDALLLPLWVEAQVKLHYMNARLWWCAWRMHAKLKRDFGALGWPVPPFKFVPIWERDDYK